MKKIFFLCVISSILSLNSCKNNNDNEIIIDFEIIVEGQAPNAFVNINNYTQGANSYLWTYSQGADSTSSISQNPGQITIDKTGDFTITLKAGNDTQTQTLSKTVNIEGINGINHYTNIYFDTLQTGNGRCFSIENARIYKDSEINELNSYLIDLVFSSNKTNLLFASPHEDKHNVNIPFPNNTTIENNSQDLSAYDFSKIDSENYLKELTIIHNNDSFKENELPVIVLFVAQDNKIGAILVKEIINGIINTEIKIQKY